MLHRESTIYCIAWRSSPRLKPRRTLCTRTKFRCSSQKGTFHTAGKLAVECSLSFSFRQNQANELLRVQQSSVEREHELTEDFRTKISTAKQEINQIKRKYDEQLSTLTREHKQALNSLQETHQLESDNLRSEMKHLFDVESEAQTKFYAQTIEELKREHKELLSKQKDQQMTQDELGQEYLKEKQQLEKRIKMFEDEIEQIRAKSQLELEVQKAQLETKTNEYQQLQKEFDQYKSSFKMTSNSLSEVHEQVRRRKGDVGPCHRRFRLFS
jgi:chromosome segregation ATPase